ncbi:Nif3-like dinuclear metal center hexameric protein [Posidoniimonas polymericola]|nr:Nif3-like dinuclear metal center hexameric protein [Posidoniimonas polymericola]
MPQLSVICELLEAFAPCDLAEDWDNTGLLLGDRAAQVERVMTCLTLTPDTVAEAVERRAGLVISHHPLPFRPIAKLTSDTVEGGMLWNLASAGIAVYSPHTAFDSASCGINASLAAALELADVVPLLPTEADPNLGAGRVGDLQSVTTVEAAAGRVKQFLAAESIRVVAEPGREVQRIAVACGSGGSFIAAAVAAAADALLTGEATFHNCLAARSAGLALLLPGHYASERFAVERLADWLGTQFSGLEVWASTRECDPLRTV